MTDTDADGRVEISWRCSRGPWRAGVRAIQLREKDLDTVEVYPDWASGLLRWNPRGRRGADRRTTAWMSPWPWGRTACT
ncbi:MAG: hypothetical protein MZV70_05010 [Desulfobacterales bacterium]|nr:hypothetical protein [Desulfobacterales bacterium]